MNTIASIRLLAMTLLGSGLLLAVASGCDKVEGATAAAQPIKTVTTVASAVQDGQRLYNQACAACHGFNGQGMPRQGASLRISQFVADHSDADLVGFIKVGRRADDPKSLMKVQMPPKGTNPSLTDRELEQIVAFIRQLQQDADDSRTASAGL